MAETYHYRVVYVWGDGQQSATVPFESLDYARKLWTRANASGDLARCYIQRRFVSDWAVTDQTNTGAAGVPATTEITGRSWDAAAAGRRAVEKQADALTRLSDEKCEHCYQDSRCLFEPCPRPPKYPRGYDEEADREWDAWEALKATLPSRETDAAKETE